MNNTTAQQYNIDALPLMMDAKAIQACGPSRSMAYALLNREDFPTVRIGKRLFVRRDMFLQWLEARGNVEGTA